MVELSDETVEKIIVDDLVSQCFYRVEDGVEYVHYLEVIGDYMLREDYQRFLEEVDRAHKKKYHLK